MRIHKVANLWVLSLYFFAACAKTSSEVSQNVNAVEAAHQQEKEHDHEHNEQKDEHASHASSKGQILELNPDTLRDLRLTVRKAEQRPAGDTITAFGSLEIDLNAVHFLSTPISARVVKIQKLLGEKVGAGEILVELESLDLGRARLSAEAAKSRVGIAKTRLDLGQKQKDRIAELAAAKMATVRELQAAEAELATRAAELSEAELQLRDAERSLTLLPGESSENAGRFALRAPNAGTVIFRDGSSGEWAEPGHVFFRIVDLSTLIAVAHPFERDGLRIDATGSARIFPAAVPGTSFEAKFLRSGPEVDSLSRTLPVRFAVPNTEGKLLSGMSITAEIRLSSLSEKEIVTVPIAAVQKVERDWCVFIPKGKGKFERRVIARGRDLGGEVEVLSGLSSGEEVVVEGAFVLRSESTRGEDTGEDHDH